MAAAGLYQTRKRSLLTIGTLVCTMISVVDGFLSPSGPLLSLQPHSLQRQRDGRCHPSSASTLWAKPGKKKAGPKGTSKSTEKSPKLAAKQAGPPAKQAPKKRSTPPWQVLSTTEAKKNVEKERLRRELVKNGEKSSIKLEDDGGPKVLSTTFLSDVEQRLLNWRRFHPVSVPAGMRFVGSYLDNRLPRRLGVPEVAFLGRSNVGKSSLLNRLSAGASTKDQARVGKTPGATASVNLYALLDAKDRDILGWVDLPGFGYAKLSKEVQESVQAAAEHYLGKRKELMLGILLVDIRRTPSEDDRAVLAALYDMGVPIVVVATKIDKVSGNELEACRAVIRNGLGLPDGQPWCVSSATGDGCRQLWSIILDACETGVAEFKSKYDAQAAEQVATLKAEVDDFVDDEDILYDQGFDWVHGEGVALEEDGESWDTLDNANCDDDWEAGYEDEDDSLPPANRETLKSLKQRARDMERRGEL